MDADPKTKSYYRLKQVDFDDKVDFLDTIVVSCNEQHESVNIKLIYATNNQLLIVASVETTTPTKISITDMQGRIVFTDTKITDNGTYHHSIKPELKSGSYLMRYCTKKTTGIIRFIIP